jgi:hypothetical protein
MERTTESAAYLKRMISGAYHLRFAGQCEPGIKAFSPKGRLRIEAERVDLPFAGEWHGRAQIGEALKMVDSLFKVEDFFIEDLLIDGDRGAIRWTAMVTNRSTGETVEVMVLDHIVFDENDQIASLTQFFDSAELGRTMAEPAKV